MSSEHQYQSQMRNTAYLSEAVEVSGNPLDFSFLKLTDIECLKKEEPRAGKRKPVEQSDDEEEQKKNENVNLSQEQEKQEGEKTQKEKTIIRAPQTQQIHSILTNNNISLQSNKNHLGGGRKQEDNKVEQKKKKRVKLVTNSIFLNNNEIRSISGLRGILDFVMFQPDKLQWLDLSYNYLENVESEILNFENLKTLYLHGNFISSLEEIKKLQNLPQLQTLTLHGNSIEQIKGYRLFVLGIMLEKYENLRKLDSVIVTNKEFDNVIVWNERLCPNQRRKLRNLKPENIKKPPPKDDEDSKQNSQGQN